MIQIKKQWNYNGIKASPVFCVKVKYRNWIYQEKGDALWIICYEETNQNVIYPQWICERYSLNNLTCSQVYT